MLSFYSLMTVILNLFILKAACNDPINNKYEIGTEIVKASIRKIQDSCIFNNDLLFMHRIAFHETTDGNDLINIWNTEKDRSGIWQNNAFVLETLQNSTNSLTENQRIAMSEELQINITDFNWESGDLEIPLNSAAVARMFISTFENSLIPFDLAGQARFWEQYYKSADNNSTAKDFIESSNEMKKCKPPGMDLIFIVDSSESIGNEDFELARNFMVSMINSSSSKNQIQVNRFGIIRFSSDSVQFLNLTSDFEEAMNIAETLPYDSGENTNIFSGFNLAAKIFKKYGRIDVPLVALLITDGQANIGGDPTPAADELKSLGVNLFTIGVGAEATTDLHIWASSPNCMFYYSLNGYMQLASVFPELLNVQICDVSAVVPINQTSVSGVVEKDQSLFYQVPANLSTGLTIKLDINEGDAIIYVSLTSRLPSSADYDFVTNATENSPGHIYISPNQLQNPQSSSFIFISDFVKLEKSEATVFIAIVGISDLTNFTLHYKPHNNLVTIAPAEISTTTGISINIPGSPITGIIHYDEPLYLQIPANINDGLSLTVTINDGFAIIFASLTSRFPSSDNNDFYAVASVKNKGIIKISPEAFNISTINDMILTEIFNVMIYLSVNSIAGETNFTLYYGPDDALTATTPTTTTVTTTPTAIPITTTTAETYTSSTEPQTKTVVTLPPEITLAPATTGSTEATHPFETISTLSTASNLDTTTKPTLSTTTTATSTTTVIPVTTTTTDLYPAPTKPRTTIVTTLIHDVTSTPSTSEQTATARISSLTSSEATHPSKTNSPKTTSAITTTTTPSSTSLKSTTVKSTAVQKLVSTFLTVFLLLIFV